MQGKVKEVKLPKTYDGMGKPTKQYAKGWPTYGTGAGKVNPHGTIKQRGKGAATRGFKSGKMG